MITNIRWAMGNKLIQIASRFPIEETRYCRKVNASEYSGSRKNLSIHLGLLAIAQRLHGIK